MTPENFQNGFYETMVEIANQVKINAHLSNSDKIIKVIKVILQIHNQFKI